MTNAHVQPHQDQHTGNLFAPLTPRDIVKRLINNYHYHVTDEDFDRMVVTDQPTYRQKKTLQERRPAEAAY